MKESGGQMIPFVGGRRNLTLIRCLPHEIEPGYVIKVRPTGEEIVEYMDITDEMFIACRVELPVEGLGTKYYPFFVHEPLDITEALNIVFQMALKQQILHDKGLLINGTKNKSNPSNN